MSSTEREPDGRIQLSEEVKAALEDVQVMPQRLELNRQTYTLQMHAGSGFKGVVWKVTDRLGFSRALKLTVYEDYENRSYLDEVEHLYRLEGSNEFAGFVDAGLVDLDLDGFGPLRFVGFVEHWVEGTTVESFLKKEPGRVSASFLVAYVAAMCRALNLLRATGLVHDDLHLGNTMVAHPGVGALDEQELQFRVIDSGSLKRAPSSKVRDDHMNLVANIIAIGNAIHGRRTLAGRDRRFLLEAERLVRAMVDPDPVVSLRDPGQIKQQFEMALVRAGNLTRQPLTPLQSPFEYISAEHIADDRLLVSIFAESCPWLQKVNGPDPCLVTGPRGCGKSTIFRWMSLKAHLHKPTSDLASLGVWGFYLSCGTDLQNRLSWINSDELASKYHNEIVHYFNLILAREILHTLEMIPRDNEDRLTYWGLGTPQEAAIHEFVMRCLGPGVRTRIQGVSRIQQAIEAIEDEMFQTHTTMLAGSQVVSTTPSTFLGDLTTTLVRECPQFGNKKIAFLIDDFSTHRLPECVQTTLNRVIWERRPSHVFKLSSEKYGAAMRDSVGAPVDVAREMVEIDIGREYIALDDKPRLRQAYTFATELLNNRLEAASYQGTAEVLVGHSDWPEGSLGKALVARRPGRTNDQYHGLETIAQLCSGDISNLLLVYRRVFELGHVTSASVAVVPKSTQHRAITDVSRELLESVRHYFPHGPEMHRIVEQFGRLVARILQEGRGVRQDGSTVPSQCPRIEIDRDDARPSEELTADQKDLAEHLIRRAIFIDLGPGRSRHDNKQTTRWHLRRVYLPASRAALAKNDAIKKDSQWFKHFLTSPEGACDRVYRDWPKHPEGTQPPLEEWDEL